MSYKTPPLLGSGDVECSSAEKTENYIRCPNCNAIREDEKKMVRKLGTVSFIEIDGEIFTHVEKSESSKARKTKVCTNCHTPVTSQEKYWFDSRRVVGDS